MQSSAVKAAPAFLTDREDSFLVVFGWEEEVLLGKFMIGVFPYSIDKAPAHGGPRGLDRKRRTFGNFGGQLLGFMTKALRSGHHVGKAPTDSFFAVDASPGIKHQAGLLHANEPRQSVSEAKTRMNA